MLGLVMAMSVTALFELDAKAFEAVESCVRSNVRIYGQRSAEFEPVWLASKAECRALSAAAKLQMMLNEMDFNEANDPEALKLMSETPRHLDEFWNNLKETAAKDFMRLRFG